MSWQSEPFLDVLCDVTSGNSKTQQSDYLEAGRFPIIDQGREFIGGYTDDEAALCRTDLPAIVFGDHTKALKFIDFPFCMGADGTKVLRPKNGADPKYLYHYLRTLQLPDAGYSRHFKYLKEVRVPLPPIEEQRRIAAILDAVDMLRAKRRATLAKLDTLARSMFIEMFGDLVANERGWPSGQISDLVAAFEGGRNLVGADDNAQSKYRVLKISAVTSLSFQPDQSKPLPPDYTPPVDHLLKAGDLLFSRANTSELVGATVLVDRDYDRLALPDKIWRARWHDDCAPDPYFALGLFQSAAFRAEVGKRATGTSGSMKNISQEKLMAIPIGIPPPDRQKGYAALARKTQQLRARLNNNPFDTLFTSLQHRAFTGKL